MKPLLTTILLSLTVHSSFCHANNIEWEISGASSVLSDNIQTHLESLNFPDSTYATQWPNQVRNAVSRASKALGFYSIKSDFEIKNSTTIKVTVIPGEPVTWRSTNIVINGAGEKEPKLLRAIKATPFELGKPINQGSYDKFKRETLSLALSLGYRDAAYHEHRLAIDLDKLSADVFLTLATGQLYHIGDIEFSGSRLDSRLLKQLSLIKPGTRYTDNHITTLYGQLLDTGYFDQINITKIKKDDNKIDLNIFLADSDSHTVTTGIGYSTDTGARIRLGWSTPIVNEAGHQFNTDGRFSEIEQKITGEYRIPLTNPLNHYLAITGGWKTKDLEDTELRIWESSFSQHSINDSGWQTVYTISLEDEKYQQGSDGEENVFYAIPSVAWSRTKLEGETRTPSTGHKSWLSIDGSTQTLGSDTDFIRVLTGLKWFKLFGMKHEVHTRLEIGAIEAETFNDIPASKRFFTGGDQSIRGFDYESLAPEDENGELIGGTYLNVASIEYRWRWLPKWYLSLFSDFGRAYNENSAPFHQGAGFGVHWQSIIAPIRFDIATPVNDEKHDGIRLHLTMGFNL